MRIRIKTAEELQEAGYRLTLYEDEQPTYIDKNNEYHEVNAGMMKYMGEVFTSESNIDFAGYLIVNESPYVWHKSMFIVLDDTTDDTQM